jgi:hypothetical protein
VPVAPTEPLGVEATCTVNISATNKGSSDIWMMLYDSEVKRVGNIGSSYVKLKIQNHRVAPGATVTRAYEASGSCDATRLWRFKLKRGTDFYTVVMYSYSRILAQEVNLGDLAKHF